MSALGQVSLTMPTGSRTTVHRFRVKESVWHPKLPSPRSPHWTRSTARDNIVGVQWKGGEDGNKMVNEMVMESSHVDIFDDVHSISRTLPGRTLTQHFVWPPDRVPYQAMMIRCGPHRRYR